MWFSLNVGRKQKAEPKWILPMLMKSGGLKKGEIGAIKITDRRTFVEVAPTGVERFLEQVGPDMKIEGAITAARIDGQPDFSNPMRDQSAKPAAPKRKSKPKRKPDDTRQAVPSDASKGESKGGMAPPKRRAIGDRSGDASFERKPRKDGLGAEKPKKPHKKKLARAAALKGKKGGKPGGVKKGERKSTRRKDRS